MSLTNQDVEAIMRLLDGSRFDRLMLEHDGLKLELTRNGAPPRSAPVSAPVATPPSPPKSEPAPKAIDRAGLVEVHSPLLGIYYRAPKPGEPPFVEVGDMVEEETVIGIIEVMKLMNSARAGVRGEVIEIIGRNGEMVEYGEPLMLVRPAA